MIQLYTPIGRITLTGEYLAGIVSTAAQSCYGVCGMATGNAAEGIRNTLLGAYYPDKGVRVTEDDGQLRIELHIKVTYGLNISAIVQSITHKVKYALEDATGLKVRKVDVFVDDIV